MANFAVQRRLAASPSGGANGAAERPAQNDAAIIITYQIGTGTRRRKFMGILKKVYIFYLYSPCRQWKIQRLRGLERLYEFSHFSV